MNESSLYSLHDYPWISTKKVGKQLIEHLERLVPQPQMELLLTLVFNKMCRMKLLTILNGRIVLSPGAAVEEFTKGVFNSMITDRMDPDRPTDKGAMTINDHIEHKLKHLSSLFVAARYGIKGINTVFGIKPDEEDLKETFTLIAVTLVLLEAYVESSNKEPQYNIRDKVLSHPGTNNFRGSKAGDDVPMAQIQPWRQTYKSSNYSVLSFLSNNAKLYHLLFGEAKKLTQDNPSAAPPTKARVKEVFRRELVPVKVVKKRG